MGKEQGTAGAGAAAASPIQEGNSGGAGATPPPGGPGGGPDEKTGGWTGFNAKMAGLKIFGGGARNGGPVDDEAAVEFVRPSCLDLFGDLKNCSGELC